MVTNTRASQGLGAAPRPAAPGQRVRRLKAGVDRALGWALTVLMGVAVFNVLWQVFTRYVLQSPSRYTDELARYLLIWVGLLGAGYALGQRLHLAIDLLPRRLTGRAHHVLGALIELLVLLFAALVLLFGGARLVGLTLLLEQTSAALRVPLGYVYLVLPVSGALMIFYSGLFFWDHLRGVRGLPLLLTESEQGQIEAIAEELHLGDPRAAELDPALAGERKE